MNAYLVNNRIEQRLLGTKAIEQKELACDNGEFRILSDVMSEVMKRLVNASYTFSDALTYRYEVGKLASRDTFISCKDYVSIYLEEEISQRPVLSSSCYAHLGSEEYENDPCCNDTVAWSQCCTERMTNFTKLQYDVK